MGSNSPRNKPRLLFLVADAPFFVSHRLPIARAAHQAGYEVHVAMPFEKRKLSMIRAAGIYCHNIPLRRGNQTLHGELRLLISLAYLILQLRPDLVHAVSLKPVILGGLVSRLFRVPAVVMAVTGLGYLFLRKDRKSALKRFIIKRLYKVSLTNPRAHVIFQNPDDLNMFVTEKLVKKSASVLIRGCGVDIKSFREMPEPETPIVVMFPARIIGDKGVHEFVEAARIVHNQGKSARFVLVGRTDPENPTNVEEPAIRSWEKSGHIEWWGFSDDMPKMFRRAHIVCMPSYMEGLPKVLIEASACGRPVVTTDVPGCREIIRHGKNGLLIPPKNGHAAAEAIMQLIDSQNLRTKFGRSGRQIVTEEFTVEQFVSESLSIYEKLLPEPFKTGH